MGKWKRTPVDIQAEKDIITGMIVSDKFIKGITTILDIDLLTSTYTKVLAKWCLEYYNIYKLAPKEIIKEIFESKSRDDPEDKQMKLISVFLENLSDTFETSDRFNFQYALDQAESYLKKRSLEILSQDIKTEVSLGNIDEAETLITKFKRIERPQSVGVDVLGDRNATIEAFENSEDILFQLPGDLGKAVGGFCRGDFVGIVGPAGRGKSWWLIETGIRGLFSNLKVLFVSMEMTQPEIIYRMILGRPKFNTNNIKIPYFDCEYNEKGKCKEREITNSRYSSCNLCKSKRDSRYAMVIKYKAISRERATWRMAVEKSKSMKKLIRKGSLKLICFPQKTKSILDVIDYMNNLEFFEHYIPDVIITDYADAMAPIRGISEYRHQINTTWEYHRGIAQRTHSVVITGSHSNKETHERKIKKSDPSEDGRKMNHLTHAIALNQSPDEEEQGIMNISILKRREGKSNIKSNITVLQSLDISKPYLDSYFGGYGDKKNEISRKLYK